MADIYTFHIQIREFVKNSSCLMAIDVCFDFLSNVQT